MIPQNTRSKELSDDLSVTTWQIEFKSAANHQIKKVIHV